MIELEHSPLGGSGAHRFMKCIGSFLLHQKQLKAGTFENIESVYAKLGTAAHEVGALCLTQGKEPYEFVGWKCGPFTVAQPGDKKEPDTIDPDALAIYVNECLRLRDLDGGKGGSELIETTIKLPEIHPLLKGTVDYGRWSTKIGMHLRDYKNGEGIGVRAVNNPQLLYYGFLQASVNPWLASNAPKDFPVTLGIVQPNFYGIYEEPDIWETRLGFVLEWGRDELVPYMHEATSREGIEDSDFCAGEWCQFCPVMLECPRAQEAFDAFVLGADDIVTLNDGTDIIAMLSNEELDAYYGKKTLARRFMNVLDTTVLARAMTGEKFDNAKLVEKKANRQWKPGAQQALHGAFGDNAFTPKKIKSPAQIEKLSSRGKELALEYGYKPDATGYSIAGNDDPRPPVVPQTSNQKAFADFTLTPPDLDL